MLIVRFLQKLGLVCVFIVGFIVGAVAQGPQSTTLDIETRNNTSASRKFRGMENGNPAPLHVSKLSLRSMLYSGANTKILARVVPFFLPSQKHLDVGYDSGDERQAARQVEDMVSRGIDGAIVDWYGTDHPDLGRAAAGYREAAEGRSGFSFAVSEDKGALKNCRRQPGCDLTGQLIKDLNYAYDHFEKSPAYLRQDDRPLVFFFDVNQDPIDWGRVRGSLQGNPLLVFRNARPLSTPESDGAFVWVDHTGKRNLPYLDDFYKKALDALHSRPVIVVGSVYKGFDDRPASWSENRVTDQECGQIWLDTFARVNHYYSLDRPLAYLQVVTWNDYEEGTEIETGIDNCVEIQPSISDLELSWKIGGNENTIDHFVIYASRDSEHLQPLAELPGHARRWELNSGGLPPGRYQLFVQAVGKPSIVDKMSQPIAWMATAK